MGGDGDWPDGRQEVEGAGRGRAGDDILCPLRRFDRSISSSPTSLSTLRGRSRRCALLWWMHDLVFRSHCGSLVSRFPIVAGRTTQLSNQLSWSCLRSFRPRGQRFGIRECNFEIQLCGVAQVHRPKQHHMMRVVIVGGGRHSRGILRIRTPTRFRHSSD